MASKKNGKTAFRNRIVNSKSTRKYEKNAKDSYVDLKPLWDKMVAGHQPPYVVFMQFVRDSRRRYDFNNVSHQVTDLMVTHDWLKDDDSQNLYVVPVFSRVDTKNPGVFIWV